MILSDVENGKECFVCGYIGSWPQDNHGATVEGGEDTLCIKLSNHLIMFPNGTLSKVPSDLRVREK